ncbi:MAG TPA: sulfate ABC transporter substrate-binding protein [Acidothermaceae bacterium]
MRPLDRVFGLLAATGLLLAAGCGSSKSTNTASTTSAAAPSSAAAAPTSAVASSAAATPASSSAAASPAASGSVAAGGPATLNLVAYSTPQPAYVKLIAAFQKTPAGKNVKFTQSYGASGDQAAAVIAGQAADVVEFSLLTDMTKLVNKKVVAADWNANPEHGFVTDSVVSLVVRKGNPKGIKDWPDLIKPGVKVLTPNPFSSGSARWNIMAAYGAQIKAGDSDAQATDYLRSLLKNVIVQDASGSKALADFVGGAGDVLLSYENEAIYAQAKGQAVDYVIPSDTLLIENPVAVTTTTKYPVQAKAFVDFLYSQAGQQIFADSGYRPTLPGVTSTVNKFPVPTGLFNIGSLGGWPAVTTKFFDPTNGVITAIEKSNGVATTK